MITQLKTHDHYIYAYIEWNIVDENTWMCDHGKILKIQDLWIHPEYRGFGIIISLGEMIMEHERFKRAMPEYVLYHIAKSGKSRQIPIYKLIRFTKYGNIIREIKNGQREDHRADTVGCSRNS